MPHVITPHRTPPRHLCCRRHHLLPSSRRRRCQRLCQVRWPSRPLAQSPSGSGQLQSSEGSVRLTRQRHGTLRSAPCPGAGSVTPENGQRPWTLYTHRTRTCAVGERRTSAGWYVVVGAARTAQDSAERCLRDEPLGREGSQTTCTAASTCTYVVAVWQPGKVRRCGQEVIRVMWSRSSTKVTNLQLMLNKNRGRLRETGIQLHIYERVVQISVEMKRPCTAVTQHI